MNKVQAFFVHPVIQKLAQNPFWTVNIEGKKPLDIKEYARTKRSCAHICGAVDKNSLTTLPNVYDILEAVPKQVVYQLDAQRDGYIVLDIEKKCPDAIKKQLLTLPFVYGEVSMSGEGYHLVFPCPVFNEIVANKIVLKEEHGYYEILLQHYVSFTYQMIDPIYADNNASITFQTIWDELCLQAKNTTKRELNTDIESVDLNFPCYNDLKNAVIRNFKSRFFKTPADFCNDMSRYEYAVIGSVRYSLNYMADFFKLTHGLVLDEIQKIALTYDIITDIIPYRPKHDEVRDGKPMLLYQVFNSFATTVK